MAKIRLKIGENEIEVESKDFYVDNKSIDEVVINLTRFVKDYSSNAVEYNYSPEPSQEPHTNYLSSLEDAEIHEPEFVQPISIDKSQIKSKIHILARDSFFEQARTVSEVVGQLHEYGWAAHPLDVSKVLTNMAFNGELRKDSREKRSYYSTNRLLEIS